MKLTTASDDPRGEHESDRVSRRRANIARIFARTGRLSLPQPYAKSMHMLSRYKRLQPKSRGETSIAG